MTRSNELDLRLSRRRLVQAGAGATAVAVLGSVGPLAPAIAAGVPAYLRRAGYADLSGTTFVANGGAALRLEAVSDLVRAATEPEFAGRDDAFALLLAGPAGLAAATHQLSHERLGSFALFLAPFGPAGETQAYEVVVDRSVRLAEAIDQAPEPLEQSNAAAAAASATPAASPARRKRKRRRAAAKPRRVLHATVARRGGVLAADVRVARGRGLTAVQLLLVRGDAVQARGFRRLGRKVGVRVVLRESGATTPGDAWLHVTTTDRRGRRATSKHRVTLR